MSRRERTAEFDCKWNVPGNGRQTSAENVKPAASIRLSLALAAAECGIPNGADRLGRCPAPPVMQRLLDLKVAGRGWPWH